ncbi:MAG: hypothetical protein R8M45_11080, partial [Ghiorsea sp.]
MKKLSLAMVLLALLLSIIMQQQPNETSQSLPQLGHFDLVDVAYLRIKHGANMILEGKKEGNKWLKADDASVEIQKVAVGQLLM